MRGPVAAALLAAAMLLPTLGVPTTAQEGPDDALVGAPWDGPVSEGRPDLPDGMPVGQARHMRIHLEVEVPPALRGLRDLPVVHTLDIGKAMRDAGYPSRATGQLKAFELVVDSLALVEVDPADLSPLHPAGDSAEHEPMLVFPGNFSDPRPFDPRENPVVTLQWILRGNSEGARHYFLYLDSTHNGPKAPVEVPEAAVGAVASAVGPGRGDHIFVPLHRADLVHAAQDPRSIQITNLQDGNVDVSVFCYDRSLPRQSPAGTQDLTALGQTWTFRMPENCREGAALVTAQGGLVTAELMSSVTSSTYAAGSSRLFIPSADGGYTGRLFTATSQVGMDWFVFCPGIPENQGGCSVQSSGTPSQADIQPNDFVRISMPGGQPGILTAARGEVAVERVPPSLSSTTPGQLQPTLWPPMDGPVSSGLFMGHALSDQQRDKLLLTPHGADTLVEVQSLVGARTVLADALDVGGPGLFEDAAGGGWGTNWDRDWHTSTDPTTTRDHPDGPARIRVKAGGPASVASGQATDGFSAMVPLQSSDGGTRYVFHLPESASGQVMGRMVLFSVHDGTDVVTSGVSPAGVTLCCEVFESLQAGEFVSRLVEQPGWWTVEASRPVVLAWRHIGSAPFSAYAPATSDLVEVDVVGAQFSGYLFDVDAEGSFQSVRPGSPVEFRLDVRNLARTVSGEPVPDQIHFAAHVPQGWPAPNIIPSTADLSGEDSIAEVTVSLRVPPDVDVSNGGATVTVDAWSAHEPRLQVSTGLGINYRIQRGILVTANGEPSEASASVAPGEPAEYTVRVTNTGSVRDRFLIQHSQAPVGWSQHVLCTSGGQALEDCLADGRGQTPELAPQQSVQYVFTVTPDASSSGRYPLLFLATSASDPSVSGSVRLITSLDTERNLRFLVNETTRVVEPGQQTVFHITIRNEADAEEELHVDVSPQLPEGWPEPATEVLLAGANGRATLEALEGVVPVPQQDEVQLWVSQGVPDGTPPRVMGLGRLIAEDRLASGATHSIDLRTVTAEVRGFQPQAPAQALAAVPGQPVNLSVAFDSLGNGEQSLRVEPVPSVGKGWTFEDSDGRPPPWNLTLPPQGRATLDLTVVPPSDAPSLPGGLPVALRSSVEGFPTVPVPVRFDVAAEPLVRVEAGALELDPGRANEVDVPVDNAGNVPLSLRASWSGFPWPVEETEVDLPAGASGTLQFNITVPHDAVLPPEVRLTLLDPQAPVRDTSTWPVSLARPALEARIVDTRPIAGGASAVQVELTNRGTAAAHDVVAHLRDGDRVLDSVLVQVVHPGETRVANLVAPSGAQGAAVVVASADDPDGTVVGTLRGGSGDRLLPAGGVPIAIVLVAALVHGLGRWRQ